MTRCIHVWEKYEGNGKFRSQCGILVSTLPHGSEKQQPTRDDMHGATCLRCVKMVRSWSLHKAEYESRIARQATEYLDRLRLSKERHRREKRRTTT